MEHTSLADPLAGGHGVASEQTKTPPERGFRRADDGARTRDPWLGKPMLYQLSYVRLTPLTIPPERSANGSSEGWPTQRLRTTIRANRTRGVRPPPARSAGGIALGFEQLRRGDEGQTMAEYAVVIGVITPVLVLLFATMGGAIVARLETVAGFLT
jgi:Flp pilus assembly pilin Flp